MLSRTMASSGSACAASGVAAAVVYRDKRMSDDCCAAAKPHASNDTAAIAVERCARATSQRGELRCDGTIRTSPHCSGRQAQAWRGFDHVAWLQLYRLDVQRG